MTNEELKRAAGNLAGLARDLERYDPWSGTRSKSDASDLRLLLSERAELLATVERLRGALKGFLRWAEQQCPCDNDQPNPCPLCWASIENLEGCKAIEAKFPRVILAEARAALTTGEANHKDKP